MTQGLKYAAVVLLSILLPGCTWLGGKEDCIGAECEASGKADNIDSATFYCYGTATREWSCGMEQDDSQIVTVIPAGNTQATPPLAVAPVVPSTLPATPPGAGQGPRNRGVTPLADPPVIDTTESDKAAAVLAFPDTSYTVQIIAEQQLEALLTYAQQVGIQSPFYTRIMSEDEPWFVLLLGIYPDYATAEAARMQWVGTRTLKVAPWVRQLAPLQEAVRQSHSKG